MGLLFAIFFGCTFTVGVLMFWRRVDEDGAMSAEEWRLFKRWVWAGQIIPLVLWLFFNLGLIGPPVWPEVAPVSAGFKKWYKYFNGFSFVSGFIIHSYWAGLTGGWLLIRAGALASSWRDFFVMCGVWSLLLFPLALVLVVSGGLPMLGVAMAIWFFPLLHLTLHMQRPKPAAPSYSRALAKISFGKYDEAELEVIHELEQCEEDFDGWMMLAELYATHFNDLAGAHRTVQDLCGQPATTPAQVSIALNRLAGWHLKFGRDPLSARDALEEICARMPGTHLERMARQRLNQLPATQKEFDEREAGKPMALPQVPDFFENAAPRALSREQAMSEANEFVEALKKNPDDAATREKFARVLAENLGHSELAIEQMQLLLTMPGQPRPKRAEWLITTALWHARYQNDLDTARLVFEQVMRDFADTPHAFAAQRRLNILKMQAQSRRRFSERAVR